ncbi:FAD-dependent oxidoreductase [Arthrobacter sp. MMS18-M83]|nr:FAD-dependent oxidoreductase [Arthrobacter sp. MMS18-M83]
MSAVLDGFRGTVLVPGDPDYAEARRIWNGAIDRRPALIARCGGVEDPALALAYARREGLSVAVRGGGHNVSGSALCEGGVVIDFSALRGVEVDPGARVARVRPGALWSDVDAATQAHGLVTPGGIVTHTGVAGLTVGGGFGWLSRRWGLTSDNLLSVRMLLADGSRVRVAADENADLFGRSGVGAGTSGL